MLGFSNLCPPPLITGNWEVYFAPPPNKCEIGGLSPPMKFEFGVPDGGGPRRVYHYRAVFVWYNYLTKSPKISEPTLSKPFDVAVTQ